MCCRLKHSAEAAGRLYPLRVALSHMLALHIVTMGSFLRINTRTLRLYRLAVWMAMQEGSSRITWLVGYDHKAFEVPFFVFLSISIAQNEISILQLQTLAVPLVWHSRLFTLIWNTHHIPKASSSYCWLWSAHSSILGLADVEFYVHRKGDNSRIISAYGRLGFYG